MEHYKKIKEMLDEELRKVAHEGQLTAGTLETIDKLSHALKSVTTIMAMEEGGYSSDYMDEGASWNYSGRNSYARGRGSNARRDSMGRYSSRGNGSSYARGSQDGTRSNYNRGYSRDDSKEEMIESLEEMMQYASTEKERQAIRKCINQLEEE